MRPAVLRFMELVHPLDHLFSRQPLELVAVTRDLVAQLCSLAADSSCVPSFCIPPRCERGFDRFSVGH